MSDLNTKSIRFPDRCYVGFDPRPSSQDDFPLGFMTEDGTDKAAQKRKQSVDRWAGSARARTLDNVPMVGFRLSRSIRRQSGWGSGNVVWRIEDPRGFELEISSPNLSQILANCVIDDGVILNECRWARLGGSNVLVPTNSDLYRTTMENSERMLKRVKPSEVKIGNRVVLRNGTEGIFMGKMYKIVDDYTHGYPHRIPRVPEKPCCAILRDNGTIETYASLQVAEITETGEMSLAEAEMRLNQFKRFVAHPETLPKFQMELLDLSRGHYNGTVVVMVEEFDNEWCITGGTEPVKGYHGRLIRVVDGDALRQGRINEKTSNYRVGDKERLANNGINIHLSWHSSSGPKSAYTSIDISKRECYKLVYRFRTREGNDLEWAL